MWRGRSLQQAQGELSRAVAHPSAAPTSYTSAVSFRGPALSPAGRGISRALDPRRRSDPLHALRFAFQRPLQSLIERRFRFFVFLLRDLALLALHFQLKEFLF